VHQSDIITTCFQDARRKNKNCVEVLHSSEKNILIIITISYKLHDTYIAFVSALKGKFSTVNNNIKHI
jgi:hypothetical protein